MRCRYGFPAPSALQGCFLNLPTEAFDEAFSSGGLLTTEPCATVTMMPCPTPRPAVRRRRWRSTRPRTSSTSRRQRCAYLPPDLCPSASLTGAMPCSGAADLLQRAADPGSRIRQRPQERHHLASRTLPARPRASSTGAGHVRVRGLRRKRRPLSLPARRGLLRFLPQNLRGDGHVPRSSRLRSSGSRAARERAGREIVCCMGN